MIERHWETERLTIADTTVEDLPQLEPILLSSEATLLLEGKAGADRDQLRRWLTNGDLPPNGTLDRYRLQTIRSHAGEPVGYLSLYHGYPDAEILYIASLTIRTDQQGKGFGGETIEGLRLLNGLSGYAKQRLVVAVLNWNAVRFWTRHRFTKIAAVQGDFSSVDSPSARLELERHCA